MLWSDRNSRGFPKTYSKQTLLLIQVRSGSMHVQVLLKILKKSSTPVFVSSVPYLTAVIVYLYKVPPFPKAH